MKYFVNDSCIGCGVCVSVCPEIFEMTDAGVAVAREGETAEMLNSAADAQSSCPVNAIENED